MPPKRTATDREWDKSRAEVQLGLANLMAEYGRDVVVAACAEVVHKQTIDRERELFEERKIDEDY